MLEILIFNKVIVNSKALGLTQEQVLDLCQAGDFKNINVVPQDTRLESVNSTIIEKFFPLAADFIFDPHYLNIPFLARMLDIMAYIAWSKTDQQISPAFSSMTEILASKCPGLSLNNEVLQQRIDAFEKNPGITLPSLQKQLVPSEAHALLSWTLARTVVPHDPDLQAFIRHCLFWGEFNPAFSRCFIREDKTFDRKPGTASISLKKGFPRFRSVRLYKGLDKIAQLQLVEEKQGSYMSPEARALPATDAQKDLPQLLIGTGDLQSRGLHHSESIVCLFE